MDKCFNCGAAVRPGAKFCTSCGTRLIDDTTPAATAQPDTSAWNEASSSEETRVETPAPATTEATETSTSDAAPFATWRSASSGWDSTAETSSSTSSPADRFEAALDSPEESAENAQATSDGVTGWGEPAAEAETAVTDRSSGWGEPTPESDDRFASWSAAYDTSSSTDVEAEESLPGQDATDDDAGEVIAVESATISAGDDTGTTPETDAAGFSAGGEHEVDYLSGDENIAAGGPDSGIAAGRPSNQSDARQRASTLVEELREMIWKIGEQAPVAAGDMTGVRNALSAVRGQTADFTDLERTIATVRENPRDVDALVQLGGKAARLEELIESHARLTAALDDAITRME